MNIKLKTNLKERKQAAAASPVLLPPALLLHNQVGLISEEPVGLSAADPFLGLLGSHHNHLLVGSATACENAINEAFDADPFFRCTLAAGNLGCGLRRLTFGFTAKVGDCRVDCRRRHQRQQRARADRQ